MEAIDEIEAKSGSTTALKEARAEALLCRAYNHFMLVNVFALQYNAKTSSTDLGVTYMLAPETTVGVKYERNTVAECYDLIKKDLEEALPNVGDSYMTVPKYHFNPSAAYAFAARFYLYHEEWENAKKYATLAIGSSPKTVLRDNSTVAAMTQDFDAISQHYASSSLNCNLLLTTSYSSLGLVFGPYSLYKRFSHAPYLSTHEDALASNIWGSASLYTQVKNRATPPAYAIFWRYPYLFEYTDPVAGVGYRHTVIPAFTTDEALLNRAEAEILLGEYDAAAADMTIWMQNFVNTPLVLTPELIQTFYNSVDYSRPLVSTIKKHINPSFLTVEEGSVQETMLQCLLGFRRIETLHMGMRWFDVKRYGITIYRRVLDTSGVPEKLTDSLTVDDNRRAIQIPKRVLDAGYTSNPRTSNTSTSSITESIESVPETSSFGNIMEALAE